MKKLFIFLWVFFSTVTWATTTMPLGTGLGKANMAAESAIKGSGIQLMASCYGTNNRGTHNPASPSSTLYVVVAINTGNLNKGYVLRFPSSLLQKTPYSKTHKLLDCGYRSIQYADAEKLIKTTTSSSTPEIKALLRPSAATKVVYTPAECSLNLLNAQLPDMISGENIQARVKVATIQDFNDQAHDVQKIYYGFNGMMGKGSKHTVAYVSGGEDKYKQAYSSLLQIKAVYPGEDNFCGGYHSPLMFFFDQERPRFIGETKFVEKSGLKTYWVESNHSGYFLARLDERYKGIESMEQLFGDGQNFEDGFSALKMLDSNFDNVIDRQDKEFKNLVLWKDKNANSKSDEGELFSLEEMNITQIRLEYDPMYKINYGIRAEAKGLGSFTFIDDKGKQQQGTVLDIFFREKE